MSDTINFINALANDDYVKADELFKKVVKNSLNNVINKNKEDVASKISSKVDNLAKDSLNKKKE